MGRSRTPSPSPARRRRSKSRERERDRNERDRRRRRSRSRDRDRRRRSPERERDHERRRDERRRSRSWSRSRSRSNERNRTKPRNSLPNRPQVTDADLEGKTPEEQEMIKMLGFCTFDTTHGKKVDGNEDGAVHVILKRKYRQYMNRKGGFNRPLDFVA
uniref:U4/U6.U5 small nuclear ribonucleoprotein 27 kDa protein n=1 Tax=Graphocephala atropunctata TaxID=36148 RepID=A0A1B6L163_9HEMI